MKVRIEIGKEMNMEIHIPDDTKYEFIFKVLRTVRSINKGEKMVENFKDFLDMKGARVFAETDDTLNLSDQKFNCPAEDCISCEDTGCNMHPHEEDDDE